MAMAKRREFSAKEHQTREYRAWINMKSRCYTASSAGFALYGGRGIRVCDRWRNSYAAFLEDMGRKPSPKHSLDRIDPNGNYDPVNCRWATSTEQARNIRVNRIITVNGSSMTLAEAVERSGLVYNTVLYRLKRGWTPEQALSLPRQPGVRP